MIYCLGILSDIGDAVVQAFRSLSGLIAALLFDFLTYLYDIFILLTNVNILDNDFVNAIYTKVGLILGIFMLFKLTFSLIQTLVDPKKLDDTSSKGIRNVVLRLIIAIVLLGFTPTIFNEAMSLQRTIVGSDSGSSTNNIIYKLIVGGTSGINPRTFGRELATDVFFSFYRDDEAPYYNNGAAAYDETVDVRYQEVNYEQIHDAIARGTSFNYAVTPLALKDSGGDYLIEYDGIFILIIGVLLIWMIFVYCFQVAVRVFQLAFLQLIAPVPILSYISDSDGTFKKWWQACLSTYLDLFIRLAIIYFVIYLSSYVLHQLNDVNSIINAGLPNDFMIKVWIKMFLLVALLMFANKLPNLLKDIFPNLGGGAAKFDFGLKLPKEAKQVYGAVAGATAATAVGLIGGPGVWGRVKGAFGGFAKGATAGFKGKKLSEIVSARAAQNVRNRQISQGPSTLGGRVGATVRNTLGMESRTDVIDRQIKAIDDNQIKPLQDQIKSINDTEIRRINDAIRAIDDNVVFSDKRKNDAIIGANKALMDRAKEKLLQTDNDVIGANSTLEYLQKHYGERDAAGLIDSNRLKLAQDHLKSMIEGKSVNWINSALAAGNDEVVERNISIINSTLGRSGANVVRTADFAKQQSDDAKKRNASIASQIVDLESQKRDLEDEKRGYDQQVETINRRISAYEQDKEALEKSKKKPQADQDAVKK